MEAPADLKYGLASAYFGVQSECIAGLKTGAHQKAGERAADGAGQEAPVYLDRCFPSPGTCRNGLLLNFCANDNQPAAIADLKYGWAS